MLNWHNLALLYKSQGRYREAEPLFQRALVIFEASFGASHPKAETCRENYAALLKAMGENVLARA